MSVLKLFFLNFFKFFIPTSFFFVMLWFIFNQEMVKLEEEYLTEATNNMIKLLSADEDLLNNQYITSTYIMMLIKDRSIIGTVNVKNSDFNTFKSMLEETSDGLKESSKYLIYTKSFLCNKSKCRILLALPKERIIRRKMILLFSALISSVFTSFVIAILSIMNVLGQVRWYKLYSERLKKMAVYISHEIKTPLSILLLNLQNVNVDENTKIVIQKAINRIIKLTAKLKIIANIDIKPTNISRFNLMQLIKDIVDFYQHGLQIKNLILKTEGLNHVEVQTDYELLYSLITNLIDNAVKYAKENTHIVLRLEKGEKYVNLSITNVIGEDSNLMEELSYGVGLSIVREVAKNLGILVNFHKSNDKFVSVIKIPYT